MTAGDFHEQMLSLLRRKPFVPFEIELEDGQRLFVEDPERVASSGGTAAFGSPSGEVILFDYRVTRRLGRDAVSASAG